MSRVKRSFWKHSHFLRMSRVKRSFWKSTFSPFVNVSCETLVLEVYNFTFCECLVWNARFGSLHSHFLRMSRVKRSFWKSTFSLFANVSCETLILEVYNLTFCACLMRNARCGSLHFHFLRMSRVKRSFWKSTLNCHFLRMSRAIRSFWKSTFSLFANVSCETLVLEVYILTFCEYLVWNARFGSLHSHFLRMSRVKRSFWKSTFLLFGGKGSDRFQTPFLQNAVRNPCFRPLSSKMVWNLGFRALSSKMWFETVGFRPLSSKIFWNLGFRSHFG